MAVVLTPRRGYRWGKAERVRKHSHYCYVQSKGRRMGAKHLLVVFAPSSFISVRHGITVSKRVGNAVVRNKVKRRLRELMRHNKAVLPAFDLVWIAKSSARTATFEELKADVTSLIVRIEKVVSCSQ